MVYLQAIVLGCHPGLYRRFNGFIEFHGHFPSQIILTNCFVTGVYGEIVHQPKNQAVMQENEKSRSSSLQ